MQNKIDTSGNAFSQFHLSPQILEALTMLGYLTPTPIQREAIGAVLKGDNLVGKSQTGSGKTAAFAIPILNQIVWEERLPQALVLEPTRELAVQVQEELFEIGRKARIKVPVVFGGMPVDKQAITLKQRNHIVVGTPGRVIDHMKRGNLILEKVKYLVIDEADLMLDMGFLEDVEYIIQNIDGEKKPQILLFSATLEEHIDRLIERYMDNPTYISISSKTEIADGIEQMAYKVGQEEKFDSFLRLLIAENPKEAMIFCDTREMVNTLFQKMRRKKIRCGMLHGGMEQKDRLYTISDFRKGIFHYLITTDVAARGIDFPDITHVFNYDFPTKRANYVHRIGRTARNGRSGRAISLISDDELHYKKAVESYIGAEIPIGELAEPEMFGQKRQEFWNKQKEKVVPKKQKGEVFNKSILKICIGGGKKSKMRAGDVVGAICSISGLTQEDIGVIDVRDSITYVEILNGKGNQVLLELQKKTIKGKIRKVKKDGR